MNGKTIETEIAVLAKAQSVWKALTDPALMKQWMSDNNELEIGIEADWKVGGSFITRGFHHGQFENTGKVLECVPGKKLVYTHLSSVSELEDLQENHCVFEFTLDEKEGSTLLRLSVSNFPTQTIFKHLELYWRTTLVVIKEFVELNFD